MCHNARPDLFRKRQVLGSSPSVGSSNLNVKRVPRGAPVEDGSDEPDEPALAGTHAEGAAKVGHLADFR